MKHILGLDLGSNSIGWAFVQQDFENKQGKIMATGSRIIPMDQKMLTNFVKTIKWKVRVLHTKNPFNSL